MSDFFIVAANDGTRVAINTFDITHFCEVKESVSFLICFTHDAE